MTNKFLTTLKILRDQISKIVPATDEAIDYKNNFLLWWNSDLLNRLPSDEINFDTDKFEYEFINFVHDALNWIAANE